MSVPLVIYHADCADGFAAAWCFRRKYGNGAEYFPGRHYKAPPNVAGRDVCLVDFSYPRAIVEAMISQAKSVALIDHHKSALEDLEGLPGLTFFCDVNRSGARLAWDYLFPGEEPPLLLGHIEDRDLWRFKLSGTNEIMAVVFSWPYEIESFDRLMKADAVELMTMTATGAGILRKHNKDVAELISTCRRRMTIAGRDVPVANIPKMMASDAGHLMAIGEAFAACYYDTAEARVFELRSSPEGLDVSVVAKQFGGGGHEHASGFSVPRDHPLAMG